MEKKTTVPITSTKHTYTKKQKPVEPVTRYSHSHAHTIVKQPTHKVTYVLLVVSILLLIGVSYVVYSIYEAQRSFQSSELSELPTEGKDRN